MTYPDARTADGMRSVLGLLEALHRNDVQTAEHILNTCDPAPTIFGLASLVISLTEQVGESMPKLLDTMRKQIPGSRNR